MVEILVPRRFAESHRDALAGATDGVARLVPFDGDEPEPRELETAEIAFSGPFEGLAFGELVPRLSALRWIHSTAAGIDDFASAELAARGVWVTNSAGAYSPAVAEYALAAMIMAARNLPGWVEAQRDKLGWEELALPGSELHGKRVGIVGYGAIGRYLARICHTIGMEVWATRRTPALTVGEPIDRLLPPEGLPELLAESDFVVLAASLNSSTRNLIGHIELEAAKPGSILVNIARGGLVDEDALLAALADGRLAAAVLDVADVEPVPKDSPLWAAPNLFLTPHIAGETDEAWRRTVDLFRSNLPLYLAGTPERMANLVDLQGSI